MNAPDYIEVVFNNVDTDTINRLIAVLSDSGFTGFEEGEQQLKAYVGEPDFSRKTFTEITKEYRLRYDLHKIQSQNWNAVWESQFEPVQVYNFVGIRAHFHASFKDKVQHEIVITPKMSFGTGHHPTTYMMIEQMQHLNLTNERVLDFGTGTGILAILSEQLGASSVLAIDIDEWSIENAKENIERNNCRAITLQQVNGIATDLKFDVVLANINKNVILDNMEQLSSCLALNGCLLVSGLLTEDEVEIMQKASLFNLIHKNTIHRQQWVSICFAR